MVKNSYFKPWTKRLLGVVYEPFGDQKAFLVKHKFIFIIFWVIFESCRQKMGYVLRSPRNELYSWLSTFHSDFVAWICAFWRGFATVFVSVIFSTHFPTPESWKKQMRLWEAIFGDFYPKLSIFSKSKGILSNLLYVHY